MWGIQNYLYIECVRETRFCPNIEPYAILYTWEYSSVAKKSVFSVKHAIRMVKKDFSFNAIVHSFLTLALDGSEWLSWCTSRGYEADIIMPSNFG